MTRSIHLYQLYAVRYSPPFIVPILKVSLGITQNDVRLSLAQMDAVGLDQNTASPVHEEITPGIFITSGIELEAQQ